MQHRSPFQVTYDRKGDVLYLSAEHSAGVEARLGRNGMVWRYDRDGALVGVTVMDFRERWPADRETLTARIAKRLAMPTRQASAMLEAHVGSD